MSNITTHILDTSRGKPAGGVLVVLEIRDRDVFKELGRGKTDDDGRLKTLLSGGALERGVHRLTFYVAEYYWRYNIETFYPEVSVVFDIKDAAQHYHVPLLLSPFGYSTYRGS